MEAPFVYSGGISSMFMIAYIALMSVVLLVMMKTDKERARRNQYRISERALWIAALLGGAIGGVLGMQLFRHKTKHITFRLGFPILALLDAVIVFVVLF